MSLGRYLIGLLLVAIALVPVGGGARALRGRLLPGWSGPPGLLVDVVIALTLIVSVSELLGLVGWYRTAPVTVGLAAAGAALWYLARRPIRCQEVLDRGVPDPVVVPTRGGLGAVVVALIATAVVVAGWTAQTAAALRYGASGVDTSWYHLPVAARFVQEGSITAVHYLESDGGTAFFPANSALLHGLGIMWLGNDLWSPLLNMAFLAFALLAAWCIGRPFGLGPATLTGVVAALGTPILVGTQPGTAYNDTMGVALLLAAAGILLTAIPTRGSPHPAVLGLTAAAAGLALGTKFQFIIPVAALTVGVVALVDRGERLRRGALWVLALGLTGGFWYIRNLVVADNPLPLVGLDLGPFELPSIRLIAKDTSLIEYVFNGQAWTDHLLPGLNAAIGPAWWALFGLVVLGLVLGAIAPRGPTHRILALVGLVSVVAFVVTPAAHGFPPRAPIFFLYTVRYSALGLALGLALLPLGVPRARSTWWALAPCGLVVAAAQLDSSIWPTELGPRRFGETLGRREVLAGLAGGAAVLLLGLTAVLLRRRGWRWGGLTWRPSTVAAGAFGLAVLAGGFGVQELYVDGRYSNTLPMPDTYKWARDVRDERIGVVGFLTNLQYPLYGADVSNHVQYVGERGPHGSFRPIRACASWRRALNDGRYSYVLISTNLVVQRNDVIDHLPPEDEWTRADPAVELVQREISGVGEQGGAVSGYVAFSLYAVDGRLDPTGCDRLAPDA